MSNEKACYTQVIRRLNIIFTIGFLTVTFSSDAFGHTMWTVWESCSYSQNGMLKNLWWTEETYHLNAIISKIAYSNHIFSKKTLNDLTFVVQKLFISENGNFCNSWSVSWNISTIWGTSRSHNSRIVCANNMIFLETFSLSSIIKFQEWANSDEVSLETLSFQRLLSWCRKTQ